MINQFTKVSSEQEKFRKDVMNSIDNQVRQ